MRRTQIYIRNSLTRFYSHQEIDSFISIVFRHIYNYSKNDLILKSEDILPESEFNRIKDIVFRLQLHEPIQYILGETEFYGMPFQVSPSVLIPRNETEELVHLILKNHSEAGLRILDIGTGSGCIPISIKKNRPDFDVFSCDISEDALKIAEKNAQLNEAKVQFFQFDILSENPFPYPEFDLIVSNPPYVTEKEKQLMEPNVLENEPHLALFVPNDDPLLFYRAIVNRATKLLSRQGEIYFEINEAYGNEVVQLVQYSGFDAVVMKDLNGKDRMVVGRRKSML